MLLLGPAVLGPLIQCGHARRGIAETDTGGAPYSAHCLGPAPAGRGTGLSGHPCPARGLGLNHCCGPRGDCCRGCALRSTAGAPVGCPGGSRQVDAGVPDHMRHRRRWWDGLSLNITDGLVHTRGLRSGRRHVRCLLAAELGLGARDAAALASGCHHGHVRRRSRPWRCIGEFGRRVGRKSSGAGGPSPAERSSCPIAVGGGIDSRGAREV